MKPLDQMTLAESSQLAHDVATTIDAMLPPLTRFVLVVIRDDAERLVLAYEGMDREAIAEALQGGAELMRTPNIIEGPPPPSLNKSGPNDPIA